MQPRGVRAVVPGVLSPQECAELTFVHRALSAAGYSPHLWTTKLSDVAYSEPALLLPLVAARDKVATAAERALGQHYELCLCLEFTGLVSWTAGAGIKWHYDSNRPYLEQRHATAVVYFNEPGDDFCGGVLEFRDGEPHTIYPQSGSMVAFLADESNTHRVTEVQRGERLTLTLWFTLLPEHSEDVKVLRQLQPDLRGRQRPRSIFQDSGSDIRVRRLQAADAIMTERSAPDSDSDPAALQAVDTARHCSPECQQACGARDRSLQFDSKQQALLAVAFAQWRSGRVRLPACPNCLVRELEEQQSQLNAYLHGLRARLPAAVAEWRSAGLLYDV